MEPDTRLGIKVVFTGPPGCGKTAVWNVAINGTFKIFPATVHADFLSKKIERSDGVPVWVTMWDTAGQECFRAIIAGYFRGANAIVGVFDITDRDTFTSLADFVAEGRERAPDAVVVVIGNKVDLAHMRAVPTTEAAAYCERNAFCYLETSAKTGHNVAEMMKLLLDETTHVAPSPATGHARPPLGTTAGIRVIDVPEPPPLPPPARGCGC